jgi:hypothetical protein
MSLVVVGPFILVVFSHMPHAARQIENTPQYRVFHLGLAEVYDKSIIKEPQHPLSTLIFNGGLATMHDKQRFYEVSQ